MHEIERHFKPEFLNRLDEVIVFQPLTREDLYKIFDIEMSGVRKRMLQHEVELEVTIEAKNWVLDSKDCQNLEFGARPLRRAIEKFIENPLSEALLKGGMVGKSKVAVRVRKLGEAGVGEKGPVAEKTELFFDFINEPAGEAKKDEKEKDTVTSVTGKDVETK